MTDLPSRLRALADRLQLHYRQNPGVVDVHDERLIREAAAEIEWLWSEARRPDPLSQALNEGDGAYRP